jgi:hypothetical protein
VAASRSAGLLLPGSTKIPKPPPQVFPVAVWSFGLGHFLQQGQEVAETVDWRGGSAVKTSDVLSGKTEQQGAPGP